MSELNESANHLARNSEKKHIRKCQQRLQIFRSRFYETRSELKPV